MKCKNCCYWWAEVDMDGKPISQEFCHYSWDDGYAPCEIDEREDDWEE